MRELRAEYGPQRPLSYQRLWLRITSGDIPAVFDRNKWWVKRGDLPIAAKALGLERLKPTAAA
jgi:hypothetical protein